MDHRRAKEFAKVVYASPDASQGENTLTVRNGKRALARILSHPTASRLDKLHFRKEDPGEYEAGETLKDILLSPVLKRFLCYPASHSSFSLDGNIIAELDRTILTDNEAFIIANVLISNFQGQVVVPDFGFYGCPFHVSLIRQDRLIAGVNFLDETALKNQLLLIKDKVARTCTTEDALVLAGYSGLLPHTNEHNDFLADAIA